MVVSRWSTFQWFQIQLELLYHGPRVQGENKAWLKTLRSLLLPVPRKPSRIVENIDSKSSLLGFCAVLPISVREVFRMWTTLPLFSYPSITWCFFVPGCCTGINNSLAITTTSAKTDLWFVLRWLAKKPNVFPNLFLSKAPNPPDPPTPFNQRPPFYANILSMQGNCSLKDKEPNLRGQTTSGMDRLLEKRLSPRAKTYWQSMTSSWAIFRRILKIGMFHQPLDYPTKSCLGHNSHRSGSKQCHMTSRNIHSAVRPKRQSPHKSQANQPTSP